jgi:hypothetical protein
VQKKYILKKTITILLFNGGDKNNKRKSVVSISQQTRVLISDIQCSMLAIVYQPILCSVSLKETGNRDRLLPLFALGFLPVVTTNEF